MPNDYRKKARELAKLAKSQRDPELRAELRELSVGYTLLAKFGGLGNSIRRKPRNRR